MRLDKTGLRVARVGDRVIRYVARRDNGFRAALHSLELIDTTFEHFDFTHVLSVVNHHPAQLVLDNVDQAIQFIRRQSHL